MRWAKRFRPSRPAMPRDGWLTADTGRKVNPHEHCCKERTAEYKGPSKGSHTFRVRVTDAAGNIDPTPAERTWKVR